MISLKFKLGPVFMILLMAALFTNHFAEASLASQIGAKVVNGAAKALKNGGKVYRQYDRAGKVTALLPDSECPPDVCSLQNRQLNWLKCNACRAKAVTHPREVFVNGVP